MTAVEILFIVAALSGVPEAKDQLWCLAKNIYFEAGNEDAVSMAAVGHVTLNRVEDPYFPDTICEVVYQHNQFSWTAHNPSIWVGRSDYYAVWLDVVFIAVDLVTNPSEDKTNQAVFYHADYIRGGWFRNHELLDFTTQIGSHLFYSWNEQGLEYVNGLES